MDLQQLQELGGLVSSIPIEKQVTWYPPEPPPGADSVTFSIYVKKMSDGLFERALALRPNGGGDWEDDDKRVFNARMIAITILWDKEGTRLTFEQAYNLDVGLTTVLMGAFTDVNPHFLDSLTKNSRPPTNSGANSSLPALAAEA
jgi:hypothetical protein